MTQNKLSKQETLEFIEYLRTKPDVLIESQLIRRRTMFGHSDVDLSDNAKVLLDLIKKSPTAIDAYRTVAHRHGRMNSLWRTNESLSYMFEEDLEEYLETYPEAMNDIIFKRWRANGRLESRDIFVNYFPTEYIRYCNHLYSKEEQKTSVTVLPYKPHQNIFGDLAFLTLDGDRKAFERRVESGEPENKISKKRLTLGFDGKTSGLDAEKMIFIARFIAEQLDLDDVSICDSCIKDIYVVHREKEV